MNSGPARVVSTALSRVTTALVKGPASDFYLFQTDFFFLVKFILSLAVYCVCKALVENASEMLSYYYSFMEDFFLSSELEF